MGTVYLIHFNQPISNKHTTQHYIGYADNLSARILHHKKGTSRVRLFEVAKERKIDFSIARIWENADRNLERRLKNQKNSKKLCPMCKNRD